MLEEALVAAAKLKDAGNDHFGLKDALAAIESYTQAVNILNKAVNNCTPTISEGATVLVSAGAGGPARSAMILTVDDASVEVMYDDDESEEAGVDIARLSGMSEAPALRDVLRCGLLLNIARCHLKLEHHSNATIFASDALSLAAQDRKAACLVVRGKVSARVSCAP